MEQVASLGPQKEPTLMTPASQICSFQDWETVTFCRLSHPVCGPLFSNPMANKYKTHCLPGNCQPIAPFTRLLHLILLCLSICVQVSPWSWGGADGIIPVGGVQYRIHWARWGGQQQEEGESVGRWMFALWSRCPRSEVDPLVEKAGQGKETGAGCREKCKAGIGNEVCSRQD